MASQPNIVFFFVDQQRWDTAGCYGQKLPVTPCLDQMADEGVKFEYAFSCQPVCGPARAALQTGKWPTEVGCHVNHRHLPLKATTLAQLMKKAGYDTGYIGKWHLASGPNEFDPGFAPNNRILPVPEELRGGYDYWLASDTLEFTSHAYDGHMFDNDNNARFFPVGRFRADAQTDWALEYLDTRKDQDKPFFLFLSYIEPHHQNDHNCYEGPHGSDAAWRNYEVPGDMDGLKGDWPQNYPDYLGCCNSLDANLGRIREKLAEMGMDENTVVIYTSDHGSHFKTRNGEYKRSCHDACLRIPLVAYGPGFTGGQVNGNLTSLIDLPKTVLAAAGAEIPEDWRGMPLQEAVDKEDWRDAVFAQISESQVGRCLRTKKWKYSVSSPNFRTKWVMEAADSVYEEEYLYDLDADPHERNNLIKDASMESVRAELRTRMIELINDAEGVTPEIVPAS